MKKKFALNAAILIGSNLLVKPFWIFGIDRNVQNRVGPEDYGLYFAAFNYSLLFSVLLDVGLTQFNSRAVSRSPARLPSYFTNLILLKCVLSLLYLAATFLPAMARGMSRTEFKLLLMLVVNQILLSFILFLRSNMQALHWFKTDSIFSVADRLLAIIFCAVLLWTKVFPLDIFSYVGAQTLALFITLSAAFMALRAKAFSHAFVWWNHAFRARILRSTFPFALLVFLMTIYSRTDSVLLKMMARDGGDYQAGVYAAAYRVFDAANQIGYLFSVILLPMFASGFKNRNNNKELFTFGLNTIIIFSAPAAVFCSLWPQEIIGILYKHHQSDWVGVFALTMLNLIPATGLYVTGPFLTAKGELIKLCTISAIAVLLNVTINIILIPTIGALACAISALATHVLVFVIQYYWVIKFCSQVPSYKEIFKLILFIFLLFIAFYAVKQIFGPLLLEVVVCSALVLLLTLLLG
ncbi:MAG: oligosaccharide flippase family protein [Chitinophagales bacterium]|nr:oligosaccharide flippase family protein [Chitinophagales bacterium]